MTNVLTYELPSTALNTLNENGFHTDFGLTDLYEVVDLLKCDSANGSYGISCCVFRIEKNSEESSGRFLIDLKNAHVNVPIITIVEDRKKSHDFYRDTRIKFLAYGACPLFLVPKYGAELVAYVEALVRRYFGHCQSTMQITKDITMDRLKRKVYFHDEEIHLEPKQYEILEILTLKIGYTISKSQIMNYLYSPCYDPPTSNVVDVFVCKIQKRFYELCGCNVIESVWGRGYLLPKSSSFTELKKTT